MDAARLGTPPRACKRNGRLAAHRPGAPPFNHACTFALAPLWQRARGGAETKPPEQKFKGIQAK
ncbi:hypothetical protein TomMM35A_00730 [Sphingobium sp. TomMM35A]